MALIGMAVESYNKSQENDNNSEPADTREDIKKITKMFAPILIPMLETMSDLDLDNI